MVEKKRQIRSRLERISSPEGRIAIGVPKIITFAHGEDDDNHIEEINRSAPSNAKRYVLGLEKTGAGGYRIAPIQYYA